MYYFAMKLKQSSIFLNGVHVHYFIPRVKTMKPKTTTTPQPLVTLAPVHHLGPATTFSDTPVVLPKSLLPNTINFAIYNPWLSTERAAPRTCMNIHPRQRCLT